MTIYFESTARKARDLPMPEAERAARVQLAACYRIFNHLGWVEMIFNHITLRVPARRSFFSSIHSACTTARSPPPAWC